MVDCVWFFEKYYNKDIGFFIFSCLIKKFKC